MVQNTITEMTSVLTKIGNCAVFLKAKREQHTITKATICAVRFSVRKTENLADAVAHSGVYPARIAWRLTQYLHVRCKQLKRQHFLALSQRGLRSDAASLMPFRVIANAST